MSDLRERLTARMLSNAEVAILLDECAEEIVRLDAEAARLREFFFAVQAEAEIVVSAEQHNEAVNRLERATADIHVLLGDFEEER